MQKIQHLCDVCDLEGAENNATSLSIQFGIDKNQMVVDLCASHKDKLEDLLSPFFLSGRRPETFITPKPPRKVVPRVSESGEFHCSVTGCDRSFTSKQAVSMHFTRVHRDAVLEIDERMERKRAADRARKQRERDDLKKVQDVPA